MAAEKLSANRRWAAGAMRSGEAKRKLQEAAWKNPRVPMKELKAKLAGGAPKTPHEKRDEKAAKTAAIVKRHGEVKAKRAGLAKKVGFGAVKAYDERIAGKTPVKAKTATKSTAARVAGTAALKGVPQAGMKAAPHALQRGKKGGTFYMSNGKKVYAKK